MEAVKEDANKPQFVHTERGHEPENARNVFLDTGNGKNMDYSMAYGGSLALPTP